MKAPKIFKPVTIFLLACLAAGSAAGQSLYRCKSNSSTYVSDRPCPGADTRITVYGPVNAPATNPSYAPPLSKAPDYLVYLSAPCAELNDAIRTAPVRGVGYSTQNALRDEYRRKCSDDESAAMQRQSEENRQQREQRKAEINSKQSEKAQSAAERERCQEMLRILHERRKRVDTMSEGERSDLQRFESSYNARCK